MAHTGRETGPWADSVNGSWGRTQRLQAQLAIAERDLAVAHARGRPNAIGRCLEGVNRLRIALGVPAKPDLPAHKPDPTLRHLLYELANGLRFYRHGFGLSVGDRVTWRRASHQARPIPGVVEAIFEFGREPMVVFKPDEGHGWWATPNSLRQEPELSLSGKVVLMPCSARKLSEPAPAERIYTGVMWQTLRAHRMSSTRLAILSARHGILGGQEVIAPYDQRLTAERANELVEDQSSLASAAWDVIGPAPVTSVLLVGGQTYRRVMRCVIAQLQRDGRLDRAIQVKETSGGIGLQRQQLGQFLRPAP